MGSHICLLALLYCTGRAQCGVGSWSISLALGLQYNFLLQRNNILDTISYLFTTLAKLLLVQRSTLEQDNKRRRTAQTADSHGTDLSVRLGKPRRSHHWRASTLLLNTGRKSGPKSRRLSPVLLIFFLIAGFGNWKFAHMELGRSEGYTPAAGGVEASDQWIDALRHTNDVKLRGTQPQRCYGTQTTLNPAQASTVVKRSLKRAQRRAQTNGMTWYRGKCYTSEDFLQMGLPPIEPSQNSTQADLVRCHQHHAPRRRMTCMTWNGGGLSSHRLDEIKQWLTIQRIQIAVITETRWSFQSTWTDQAWHHVHSADPSHRGTGVVILIAKTVCPAPSIRWMEIIPGRLLHVRLLLSPRNLDILGCYQHVYNRSSQCLPDRARFWQALDQQQLVHLPKRNTLILLGDMNCSLPSAPGICGTSTFWWKGTLRSGLQHPDNKHFLAVLNRHGVVVLNSWTCKAGPTYVHGEYANRIDYICTRRQLADGRARDVQYVWQAPFLPIQPFGHAPLMCHLALYWIPPEKAAHGGLTADQRQRGLLAQMTSDVKWTQYLTCSAEDVTSALDSVLHSDAREIHTAHATALHHFNNAFPATSESQSPDPWQLNPHLLTKWQHRHRLRTLAGTTKSKIFSAWFHIGRFQKLTRDHRRFAKLLRRQRFEAIVQQAEVAAVQHNTKKLFDLVNRFAPKAPKRKIQLRNDNGVLATSQEEQDIFAEYVRTTWNGPSMTKRSCAAPPGVPFTVSDLERALVKIPASKAVAPGCAPGFVWSSHARLIAPMLHQLLTKWWSTNEPWIPHDWRAGWLVFIPKAGKPPTCPQNLRPLALQCPIGKAIMGILISQAALQADPLFRTLPLWAFMPHRSTQDCLNLVASHCRAVRDLLNSQRSTPHSRALSEPRYHFCGGIQIYLDLERAFDNVSRSKLFDGLQRLNISDHLVDLLQAWHVETSYYVGQGCTRRAVEARKGLRQGCKGSPFLWNSLIALMLLQLKQCTPPGWVETHLTFYADDGHVGGIFYNYQEFTVLLNAIGRLFLILTEYDLKINPAKSVALVAMTGIHSRRIRAAVIQKDLRGEMLKIPVNETHMLIPVQHTAQYLGCIMSYRTFEDTTLWHRAKLAHAGFARLRRWLCNKHAFSIKQRLRLWQSCIMPMFTYGIFAIGVTQKGMMHLITQICKMLRLIVRDHPHHTGNTNSQVFTAFALPTPDELLNRAVANLQRSIAQRQLVIPPHDIALRLSWSHLQAIPDTIAAAQVALTHQRIETALSAEVIGMDLAHKCQLCLFHTNSTAAFRRHCTVAHGQRMYRHYSQDMSQYTNQGLPQCKFCGQTFSTWRYFRTHVERGCQAIQTGPTACTGQTTLRRMSHQLPQPSSASVRGTALLTPADMQLLSSQTWGERVLSILEDQALHLLRHEPEACRYLSKYCFICGQHLHRTQDLNLHFRTEHSQFWAFVPQKALLYTNLYSTESPCDFCGGCFRTHQCPFWTQVAVMVLHGAGLAVQPAHTPPNIEHRCEVCLALFPDMQQLTTHLQQEHKLVGQTFNIARDSIDSQAACAHCGSVHATMDGLRSHITQGRCRSFNSQATAETSEITQLWHDICLHGKLFDNLRMPMTRLRLTTKCAHCSQVYSRAGDLANHLMNCHARVWRSAQRLTLILVDLVFARHGCVCNPMIHQLRQNHVCLPLRQIAMMHVRIDREPFMPTQITDEILTTLVHPQIPRGMRFKMEQLFAQRKFSELWTDAEVTMLLSQRCILCGELQHPALLCRHLHEAHTCGHTFADFYGSSLLPVIQRTLTSDFRCDLCQQIFNLPPSDDNADTLDSRQALVRTHLCGACPVFLQCTLLLGTALNGGRLGDEWMGRAGPGSNPGNLPVPELSPGHGTQAEVQSQTTEAETHRRTGQGRQNRSRSTRVRVAATTAAPSDPGPTGLTARAQLELAAKHRLFHHVLPGGTDRGLDRTDPGEPEMARAAEIGQASSGTAPSTPVPVAPDGPLEPGDQGGGKQAGRTIAQDLHGEKADQRGYELAIPQMGPQPESLDDRLQEGHQHAEDVAALDGPERGFPRTVPGLEIPGPDHVDPADYGPVETAAEPASRSTTRLADGLSTLGHLDAGGNFPQATLDTTQWACEAVAPDDEPDQRTQQGCRQSQGQRVWQDGPLTHEHVQRLRQLTAHLAFSNPSTWCFANTTLYGILWALLSQQQTSSEFWGPHFSELCKFLEDSCHRTICLEDQPWFLQILKCWGKPQAQQDCGEFIYTALKWLESPAVDMQWERRVALNEAAICQDHSHACLPLFLQFSQRLANMSECTVAELILLWHQADGMRAALCRAAPIVCLHVDRMFESTTGQIEKSSCAINLDSDVMTPVFTGTSLDSTLIRYVPVAGVAHFGHDGAGHYQSLLKIQPGLHGTQPMHWLLTQDNVCPVAIWRIPDTIRQNFTVIWMVRADCLQLPEYRAVPAPAVSTAAPSEAELALLALLQVTASPG